MKLRLERVEPGVVLTLGILFVNEGWAAFTLEDVVREPGVKIPGNTAIPYGSYKVIINESARFGRRMPRLVDVPNFEGILIHPGNTTADTAGCILVGMDFKGNSLIDSRLAFDPLFAELDHAFTAGEEITIDIVREA